MAKVVRTIAIGAAIAGAAGYVAGILTSPKSGQRNRKDLKKVAHSNFRDAEKQLKGLHTELGKLVDDVSSNGTKLSKDRQKDLKKLMDKAGDSKQKVREVLSAIHEGDADDSDLKKAITDAKRAVSHLRDFITK
jgi:gas vesicle protein